MRKIGIVRFLGTNCDRDIWKAVELAGDSPKWLWHADHFDSSSVDGLVIPGGFSYGDYLRSGALASRSPVMDSVREAAKKGIPVLGICNGFQVLCEAELLPGALVQNEHLRFVCKWQALVLENGCPAWGDQKVRSTRFPIAHGDGRFVIEEDGLKRVQDQGQIWWKYSEGNPNGSADSIAGITNEAGNVAGMMPHPERAMTEWMGSTDGLEIFRS